MASISTPSNSDENKECGKCISHFQDENKLSGKCSICFQTYMKSGKLKPTTLPCSHIFCSGCILNIIIARVLVCPTCQTKHPFPFQDKSSVMLSKDDSSIEDKNGKERETQMEALDKRSREIEAQVIEVEKELLARKRKHEAHLKTLTNIINENEKMIESLDKQSKFLQETRKKGDEDRKQMEEALDKLNEAESYEEIFSVIGEVDHCYNTLCNWKQNFEQRTPNMDAIISKSEEMTQNTKIVDDIVEETDRLSEFDPALELQGKMSEIKEELSKQEKAVNDELESFQSSAQSG